MVSYVQKNLFFPLFLRKPRSILYQNRCISILEKLKSSFLSSLYKFFKSWTQFKCVVVITSAFALSISKISCHCSLPENKLAWLLIYFFHIFSSRKVFITEMFRLRYFIYFQMTESLLSPETRKSQLQKQSDLRRIHRLKGTLLIWSIALVIFIIEVGYFSVFPNIHLRHFYWMAILPHWFFRSFPSEWFTG